MAVSFTQGNDFIVPTEDGQTYLGGAGNDTYMLSDATIAANSTIVIQDTEGTNNIQLVGGLSITSSLVTSNALELTLSNGAKVQILGADSFGYDVGGNALGGVDGTDQTFTELVETTLGTTVPAAGEDPSTGGTVEVPDATAPATPTFSVAASAASVTEGGDATFTVSLSAAQATATTVAYALAGTGGAVLGTDTTTVADATLTFAAGETTKTVTVPVTFDTETETGEGMTLTLSAPSTGTELGTSSAAVAFADPAAPTFTLTSDAVAGAATEEGQDITYTITPSSITDQAYTFTLSTLGDTVGGVATAATAADFSPASQTITFAAGTTEAQTVVQTIANDGTSEGLEGYVTSLLDSSFAALATSTGLITDPTSGTGTGTNYTLTTSADSVPGTTGNDTITGAIDDNTAANNTFTVLDTINGGAGTDTLFIAADVSGAALSFPSANVSNVEVFEFRNVSGQTLTVDSALFSGETTLSADRSSSAVTFNNVSAGVDIKVAGDGATTNAATTANYSGSVTSATLTIDGSTMGTNNISLAGTGVTSLGIASTGGENTVGTIAATGQVLTTTINATTALTATGLTVATNTGNQSLVITGSATDVSAKTAAAAHSAVELGILDTDFVSLDASGMTAGGVSATLSTTTTATFTGGAGNDTLTTSTSGQTGAVDAGTGTDTLVLTDTSDIDTTAEGALYKGFEVLHVDSTGAAVSIDMDTITGSTITQVMVEDAANATSITDMSATQAANVTIVALAGAATLGVKNATQVGTLDTMNITVSDGDTTGSEAIAGAGDLTIAGVETINITATDDLTLATMANITGLTSMTVTGDGDVSITTQAHAASANESVNFSGLTAASTFNFSAATGNAIAFTGGSGIDTVTDNAVGGSVISTGAGADAITLTAKTSGNTADLITMGTGADSLNVTAAKGNVGYEQITLSFAAGDTVIDGSVTGTGYTATKMDAITGVDLATAAAAGAGHVITFDTAEKATSFTFGSSALTFGTTTVSNAYDFYVYNTGAGGVTYIYQDTDGDKIIEDGEFGIQLTGVAATATASGEFSVTTAGDLLLSTL